MSDRKTESRGHVRRRLSARYLTELRSHLAADRPRDGSFGRAALAEGLATFDVALMHQQAVLALTSPPASPASSRASLKRAVLFFIRAVGPIEAVQRAAQASKRQLERRNAAMAVGHRRLEGEIARRKASEAALRKAHEEYRTLYEESQAMQRKLRQLTRQILRAQEDERKEISRELHDEVMQTLLGINVELSNLGEGAALNLRALKARIARTRRVVENSVKAVHRFARELRPAALDDFGLIPALHAYSQSVAERKKFKVKMTAFSGVEALGSAKRMVLFRVAQEALTNIARHAQATQVSMRITEVSGAIRMEIGDNGKAFDVEKIYEAKNPARLGLLGMRERVEMIGGKFGIESTPGKGTTVRVEIPCARARRPE